MLTNIPWPVLSLVKRVDRCRVRSSILSAVGLTVVHDNVVLGCHAELEK